MVSHPSIGARSDESFLRMLPASYLSALEASGQTVYGVWEDLTLAYTNPSWFSFASQNAGDRVISVWPIGRSVADAIPPTAQDWYREFFAAAFRYQGAHPPQHEYECSSAELYRRFHMTAYALCENSRSGLVIVHSLLIETPHTERPGTGAPAAAAAKVYTEPTTGLICQCMHCRRVRRPLEPTLWDWVPVLLREPQPNVTHGMCEFCSEHFYSEQQILRAVENARRSRNGGLIGD